jgi:hypothetical protein
MNGHRAHRLPMEHPGETKEVRLMTMMPTAGANRWRTEKSHTISPEVKMRIWHGYPFTIGFIA